MQRTTYLLHDSHPDQEGTKGPLTGKDTLGLKIHASILRKISSSVATFGLCQKTSQKYLRVLHAIFKWDNVSLLENPKMPEILPPRSCCRWYKHMHKVNLKEKVNSMFWTASKCCLFCYRLNESLKTTTRAPLGTLVFGSNNWTIRTEKVPKWALFNRT